MPARRGGFSASLSPFGGGILNLDAAYAIGALTPTPDPPVPAPPPQEPHAIPVVGTTPVPPAVIAAPEPLPAWRPATPEELADLEARKELQRRQRLRARRIAAAG